MRMGISDATFSESDDRCAWSLRTTLLFHRLMMVEATEPAARAFSYARSLADIVTAE
jgi:hypothetical protein